MDMSNIEKPRQSPLMEGKGGGEEQMKVRIDFELESHVQFPTASEL